MPILTEKKFEATMNAVQAMERAANTGAYIVLDSNNRHAATIRVKRSRSNGSVTVCLADWTEDTPRDRDTRATFSRWTVKRVRGYGFDKVRAALSGMTIAGVTFQEDSGASWQSFFEAKGMRVICAI